MWQEPQNRSGLQAELISPPHGQMPTALPACLQHSPTPAADVGTDPRGVSQTQLSGPPCENAPVPPARRLCLHSLLVLGPLVAEKKIYIKVFVEKIILESSSPADETPNTYELQPVRNGCPNAISLINTLGLLQEKLFYLLLSHTGCCKRIKSARKILQA